MTLLNRCKLFMCASVLLAFAGGSPAHAMTQNDFNALVKDKGCKQALDQASEEKTSLQDIARMSLDPGVQDSLSCILDGVVSKALAEGMSPQSIIQMFLGVQGLNPTVFLPAMVRTGISENEVKDAARDAGISQIAINQAITKARVADNKGPEDDTQAFTPADGGGAAPVGIGAQPVGGGAGGATGIYASPSTL